LVEFGVLRGRHPFALEHAGVSVAVCLGLFAQHEQNLPFVAEVEDVGDLGFPQ
jgi:hypothetical protein